MKIMARKVVKIVPKMSCLDGMSVLENMEMN
jgi:hypothetical protein